MCNCITNSKLTDALRHLLSFLPIERVNCVHLCPSRAMYVTIKTVIKQIANYTISCMSPPSAPAAPPLSDCPSVGKCCATQKHWTGLNACLTVLIKEIEVRTLWTQIRFEWWWFDLRQDMLRSLCVPCCMRVCAGTCSHAHTYERVICGADCIRC